MLTDRKCIPIMQRSGLSWIIRAWVSAGFKGEGLINIRVKYEVSSRVKLEKYLIAAFSCFLAFEEFPISVIF